MQPTHIADFSSGKSVPPLGQPPQPGRQGPHQFVIACSCGFTHQSSIKIENLFNDLNQFVHSRIADAVLASRRQRKQSLKAEDVPWINKGTTSNAAVQQILDLWQTCGCFAQLSPLCLSLSTGQMAEDLAQKAYRHSRDAASLFTAGFWIAHFSEQQGQIALLQLQGTMTCQVSIEMLPSAAEGLPRCCPLLAQALGVRSLQLLEQFFIKEIAITCTAR